MLLIVKLVGMVFGDAVAKFVEGALKFLTANFKYILLAACVLAVFHGGRLYERQIKDKEILEINEAVKKKEQLRDEGIELRVTEAEKLSDQLANKIRELEGRNAEASKTIAEYEERIRQRQIRILEITLELEKLRKMPGDNKQRLQELESELTGLRMTYTLSPVSVEAINKFVDTYREKR